MAARKKGVVGSYVVKTVVVETTPVLAQELRGVPALALLSELDPKVTGAIVRVRATYVPDGGDSPTAASVEEFLRDKCGARKVVASVEPVAGARVPRVEGVTRASSARERMARYLEGAEEGTRREVSRIMDLEAI